MKAKLTAFILICFLLTACSNRLGQTPTPLPTVVLGEEGSSGSEETPSNNSSGSTVSSNTIASGILVTNHLAEMAFQTAGTIEVVNVTVGKSVKAGEILVELDNDSQELQLQQAELVRIELTSPLSISKAQQAVANDQSALNAAQGTYNWWLATKANESLITKAKADLAIALDELDDAQEDYNKVDGEINIDADKAAAYNRLYTAQVRVKDARYKVDLYESVDPYQMAINKAALDVAKAQLQEDQTLLAALTGGTLPENPTGTEYSNLLQAQINVKQAQENLQATQLVSPFDGIITQINAAVGNYTAPGQIQVVVIDPKNMHVETTDLSERDIQNVKVGQEVEISIDPINENTTGKVTAISHKAESLGGDVVYRVYIEIKNLPESALAGMSVTVNFLTDQ